jgi:MFS transporter, DHA1 family, inner membrane transport protein
MFVTSLYAAAAAAGYVMGGIAGRAGWASAGELQISALSAIAGILALTLRPDQMSL